MSTAEPGRAAPAPRHARPGRATDPDALDRRLQPEVRHLVVAAAAGMIVLGVTVLPNMHVDVFPEFAPPPVLIQTACVGLSTSDVEQLVTGLIEHR